MRYERSLQVILMLAASLTAGIALGDDYDYLGGGYVASLDRSAAFEPGIAGMVKWLDQPVPYSTFAPYREYYVTAIAPQTSVVSQPISSPAQYNITGRTPNGIYYGNGQMETYSTYALSPSPARADLWIAGMSNWTAYAIIPVGASIQLLANVPAGGIGSLYKVVQTNSLKTDYQAISFNPGYSSMSFWAGQTGRHMLYFVVNNVPSNVVVVDVFSQAPG